MPSLWKFINFYESLSIPTKVYTCIFFIYRSVPRGGIWERGIERSDEDRVMILKNYPSIVSVRSLENQISTLYSYMWIYERCMGLKKSLKKASVITILRLLEYIFILHCKYHLPINFHVCQVRHCEFTWFKDLWHHFTEAFTQNIKLRTFSRSS